MKNYEGESGSENNGGPRFHRWHGDTVSLILTYMAETRHDIQKRTFAFACSVIEFCDAVPDTRPTTRHLLQQLFRAGTSVGANLEEAAAGQTKPDFIAKTFVSLKEARETRYWLRLISACRPQLVSNVAPLTAECEQLVAILTAILRSARMTPSRGK